jgi:hypothetical protein
LKLPSDRPRPVAPTRRGDQFDVEFGAPLAAAVRAFSRRESTTPFIVLLAAYKTLLMRLSGQTDVVVGSPFAGRDNVLTERIVGSFLRPVALRTALDGDPTVREAVRRTEDTLLEAMDHQAVPVPAAKYPGNYAAGYAAQAQAVRHGCDQVVWLDARTRRWVEELSGMNLLFVEGQSGRLVTPPLAGTILPGVTRQSILELAGTVGLTVVERPISVDEWEEGCRTDRITEVFSCGTAAQITSIGRVRHRSGEWQIGDGSPGPVAERLGALLSAIHRGTEQPPGTWVHRVGGSSDDIGETVT